MYAQRINIFNKADSDHVVLRIADNFQLKLFPSKDRLLYQNLTNHAGLQASCTHGLQFFYVIYKTAAFAAHGVSRTKNNRITQFICDCQCILNAVGNFTSSHLDAQAFHCMLKLDTVLTTLDSINLNADYFNIIFIQNTCCCQFGAEVQSGLSTQVREQRIRALFFNDLSQTVYVQRLNISHICCLRIRHNRSRIGIDQHNLIAEFSQCLAHLCSRIIELTRLSDNDWTGTDNQYFVNVISPHVFSLSLSAVFLL